MGNRHSDVECDVDGNCNTSALAHSISPDLGIMYTCVHLAIPVYYISEKNCFCCKPESEMCVQISWFVLRVLLFTSSQISVSFLYFLLLF